MQWKNIYRGIIMGISDLIPGVSGSTIAVILGFYDQLLDAISGFFSKEWKKSLRFLIPLGIGVGITLVVFSKFIHFLLENYEQPTQFFFLGLIIGVIPLLFKQSQAKTTFKVKEWTFLILAGIVVGSMAFLNPLNGIDISVLSPAIIVFLFISGWLASMAMLLPGISGSFVLLLLGAYDIAITALSTFNLPIILIIGMGVGLGFIISSKGIKYLLQHYHSTMYAIIIGLVFGSIFVVYPGFTGSIVLKTISIITFIIGFIIVRLLSTVEKD